MSNNEEFHLQNVFNVHDKVALVTGGGSGIGLMAAQALAVNGAKAYIVGRTKEKLEQAIKAHGQGIKGQIIPLVGDVSHKEGVEKIYQEFSSKEKCLCILINNAGISSSKTPSQGSSATELKKNLFENANVDDWTSVYTTNVVGPYLMTTAFLPLLENATKVYPGFSGCVINITSISGMMKISQGQFPYNVAKSAYIHLNRLLSSEIATNAGVKIRVNSIAPGLFPSEMTTGESGGNQKSYLEKGTEQLPDNLPSQRPGTDKDMASAVLFVACNQYMNGQNIVVDGGYEVLIGQ